MVWIFDKHTLLEICRRVRNPAPLVRLFESALSVVEPIGFDERRRPVAGARTHADREPPNPCPLLQPPRYDDNLCASLFLTIAGKLRLQNV